MSNGTVEDKETSLKENAIEEGLARTKEMFPATDFNILRSIWIDGFGAGVQAEMDCILVTDISQESE